jgi:hypothetical protein
MSAGAVFSVPQKSFGMKNYFCHLSAKKVGPLCITQLRNFLLVGSITCKIYVQVTMNLSLINKCETN